MIKMETQLRLLKIKPLVIAVYVNYIRQNAVYYVKC